MKIILKICLVILLSVNFLNGQDHSLVNTLNLSLIHI